VDLIDAKGSSYTWRIFERIEEKKPTNDTRTGFFHSPPLPLAHFVTRKTTNFKGELNALKVNYIVCLIQPNTERYDAGSLHRSKIGVVHEQDLLNLEDREIEYILSVSPPPPLRPSPSSMA
jgi:hypothetical protein